MSVTIWPLTEGEDAPLLQHIIEAFQKARPETVAPFSVGVAVSGGGDSMALLHLMHRAAPHLGFDLRAVTVDHGLRAAAATEAAQVAGWCASHSIAHDTLVWDGPLPTGNLMDQARRARAALIGGWARGHGLGHVALGHTADDEAETFLMNLSRSAGLDGLAGMRKVWADAGVTWVRPLLDITRAELRDYLRRKDVAWIDDPTNDDDHYTRVKARRALKALIPLGITVAGLNTTISNLRAAQSALQSATHDAAQGIYEHAGALRFGRDMLRHHPQDITRRLLIAMIRWIAGTDYPPRSAKMVQLEIALTAGRDATLGGVRFQCRNDMITVTREPRATMAPVPLGQVWDHRWRVTGPGRDGLRVGALGTQGLRDCPDWRRLGSGRNALVVTPAVWDGTTLIAAPLAGMANGWQAELGPSLRQFILSH